MTKKNLSISIGISLIFGLFIGTLSLKNVYFLASPRMQKTEISEELYKEIAEEDSKFLIKETQVNWSLAIASSIFIFGSLLILISYNLIDIEKNYIKNFISIYYDKKNKKKQRAANYFQSAKRHLLKKEYDIAYSYFSEAIKFYRRFALAYYHRGLTKIYQNEFEMAIEDFNKAIKYKKELYDELVGNSIIAQVYLNRGKAMAFLENYQKAIEDYNKVIEIDNSYLQAYLERCYVNLKLSNFEEVVSDSNAALNLKKDNIDAIQFRAESNFNLKNYDYAIKDYSSVIEINNQDESSYLYRAKAKFFSGDYEGANADIESVLKINPENSEAYFTKGEFLLTLGERNHAKVEFTKAHELGHNTADLWLMFLNSPVSDIKIKAPLLERIFSGKKYMNSSEFWKLKNR